ncbi:MAG: nickel pincer cofactor biosynthesis protein LarC [Candidatus Hydrogenedentes bacterium]|jgi:uncharacterized protein (TIGR00299 family) protein|nr:nickel pincer cofactor biosynthesis protein LarC [Candidatus Hydrogenedentota bacterium]
MKKDLYLDCFCGISGDMTVGALIDAGADPTYLLDVVASMNLSDASFDVDKVNKKGITATHFKVQVDPNAPQPHRHLSHIIKIIEETNLDDQAKAKAIATFERIGAAEASVHGIPVEKVHFHEVGAIDSIMDIVLANAALSNLNVGRVICSPLTVGSGTVKCDHGIMPVPAPATALLLSGIPWSAGDVAFELATPTGVALAKEWSESFGPAPEMTTDVVGYGAGTRDLSDRANVLRVFLGNFKPALPAMESITLLETNIDDMNPELLAQIPALLLEANAKDVFITPVLGKKGRLSHLMTVLTDEAHAASLARLLFENTSTLGIRTRQEQRWALTRKRTHVVTPWGSVPIKIGQLDGEDTSVSPEFEVCRNLAQSNKISVKTVYESALLAALKKEYRDD